MLDHTYSRSDGAIDYDATLDLNGEMLRPLGYMYMYEWG
jgi:hypothetical protein